MYLTLLRMCLEIYLLDPANFISATVLAWKASLKRDKLKLDLLIHIVNGRKRYQQWNMLY